MTCRGNAGQPLRVTPTTSNGRNAPAAESICSAVSSNKETPLKHHDKPLTAGTLRTSTHGTLAHCLQVHCCVARREERRGRKEMVVSIEEQELTAQRDAVVSLCKGLQEKVRR